MTNFNSIQNYIIYLFNTISFLFLYTYLCYLTLIQFYILFILYYIILYEESYDNILGLILFLFFLSLKDVRMFLASAN